LAINGIPYPQDPGLFSIKIQAISDSFNISETAYIEVLPQSFSFIKLKSTIKSISKRNLIKISLSPEIEIKKNEWLVLELPTKSLSDLNVFSEWGGAFTSKDGYYVKIEIISPKDFESKFDNFFIIYNLF
jgi:hypothetical protein